MAKRPSKKPVVTEASPPPAVGGEGGETVVDVVGEDGTSRKKRVQWWEPFTEQIMTYIIGPALENILRVGVASKSELIAIWSATYGYTPTSPQMNEWLAATGLSHIFDAPKHFQLSPPEPPAYMTQQQAAPPQARPMSRPTSQMQGMPTPAPSQANRIPEHLRRALANLSENDLRDPQLVREALALAQENPHITPIVPSHVPTRGGPAMPYRTVMGPNGPGQAPLDSVGF